MTDSQEFSVFSPCSGAAAHAREARQTARAAFTATLATTDEETGYPFATLVSIAVSEVGDPLMLLSGLARHTKNLAADRKASLLFEAQARSGDPLASGRVTVQGDVDKAVPEAAQARYLARHPEATSYADFSDFNFYKMRVTNSHYIAGFGRIASFPREAFCLPESENVQAATITDFADAADTFQATLQALWRRQVGGFASRAEGPGDKFAIVGFDRDGLDVRCCEAIQRLHFPGLLAANVSLKMALQALSSGSPQGDHAPAPT